MTFGRTIPRLLAAAISISLPWSGPGSAASSPRQASTPSAIALPEGAGKRYVERLCGECHDPSLVVFTREDQDGWAVIVNDMGARGAKAKPEELQIITSYLAEHFNRQTAFTPFKAVGAGAATARDEQQLFAAGKEIYGALCAVCHQPDGKGRDNVAPALVGSNLALAAPAIPVRIMLHGKRGPANVMPALGSLLSDEQIAAVLTYVRREWGQTGSPVDAATVKEIRGQTAGRARPWTAEELSQLSGKGEPYE
jgi:mono/diheme cytochrome c family protein